MNQNEEWEESLIINLTDDGLTKAQADQYVDFVKEVVTTKLTQAFEKGKEEAERGYCLRCNKWLMLHQNEAIAQERKEFFKTLEGLRVELKEVLPEDDHGTTHYYWSGFNQCASEVNLAINKLINAGELTQKL